MYVIYITRMIVHNDMEDHDESGNLSCNKVFVDEGRQWAYMLHPQGRTLLVSHRPLVPPSLSVNTSAMVSDRAEPLNIHICLMRKRSPYNDVELYYTVILD